MVHPRIIAPCLACFCDNGQMAEPKRSRSLLWWVGILLILAGVGLLAWVGWQFYGTNWVAQGKQREAVTSLERSWQQASDPKQLRPKNVAIGNPSALIRIPKFGADYVMPVFEGVGDDVLAKGYGHFAGEGSANPGQVGNYALAAHRVTHGEPLRRMPILRPGDEVIVETVDKIFSYQLDTNPNDLIVPFTEGWVVDPVPKNPKPGGVGPAPGHDRLITLTTCSELFHTDGRMVAFGHLVSAKTK